MLGPVTVTVAALTGSCPGPGGHWHAGGPGTSTTEYYRSSTSSSLVVVVQDFLRLRAPGPAARPGFELEIGFAKLGRRGYDSTQPSKLLCINSHSGCQQRGTNLKRQREVPVSRCNFNTKPPFKFASGSYMDSESGSLTVDLG
eukprot:1030576-Rhodomonas_salina.1